MRFSAELVRGEYGMRASVHEFVANDPVHARYVKKRDSEPEECAALASTGSYHPVIRF
jgi:hypothetical protein